MTERLRYRPAEASSAEYLHVSGVGLRVDHVPAGPLWERVQRHGLAEEEEPTPSNTLDKCRERAGLFRSAALRAALTYRPQTDERSRFVENYPVPTRVALPPAAQMNAEAQQHWKEKYLNELLWQLHDGPAGMAFHKLGFRGPLNFEDAGIDAWLAAWRAFDVQGDLNSQLVWAEDGYAVRADLGGWQNPPSQQRSRNPKNPQGQPGESLEDILARPKQSGQLRDVFSALLLTRPEAAEWLREWSLHVNDSSQTSSFPNGVTARGPHGFGTLNTDARDGVANYRAQLGNFSPTPNVPELWTKAQYEQYAQTPTLALLFKPELVRFDAGMGEKQRADALASALKAVLEGNALRQRPPTRLFYSAAADGDAVKLLSLGLTQVAPQSGLLGRDAGFHLEQCLGGDLGAASMNAAIGLASIAVWESSEPALVINLRDPGGALVFALWPVDEEYRKRFSVRPYVI